MEPKLYGKNLAATGSCKGVSSRVARIDREASEIRDWRGTSSRAGELGGRR
jgi:hypothetical protein